MNPIGKTVLGTTGKAALNPQTAHTAANALAALTAVPGHMVNLFRHRFPSVAVTGMTGVGKTRLVDTLVGRASVQEVTDAGSAVMERRTSKSARLKGFRFRVVPGDNAATRLGALDEVFHDEPVDGILHVVSFGHATPRRAGGTTGAAPAKSIDEQLQAELDDWAITAHRIAAMATRRDRPVWLIIAVTKADLFADSVDKAVEYYSPGSGSPFAAKLDELRSLAGGSRLSIDVLPVSAESDAHLENLRAKLAGRMKQLSGHV